MRPTELTQRYLQVADREPLDRGYQVIIRKAWPWNIVGDLCGEFHSTCMYIISYQYVDFEKGKQMRLQNTIFFVPTNHYRFSVTVKTVVLKVLILPPLLIILIVIELVLILNMHKIFAIGHKAINSQSNEDGLHLHKIWVSHLNLIQLYLSDLSAYV